MQTKQKEKQRKNNEQKLKKYLDLQNLNISKKLFDNLQENNKLNQEGLLEFSKEK